MTPRGSIREALRIRDFRRQVIAFLINSLGSWAYSIVLTVYVFDRTGSTAAVTLFLCAAWVPKFFAAPYAGVLADRYERTRVMQVSALCGFLTSSVMAVLVISDGPLPLLLLMSAVTAVVTTPYNPASQALLVDLVPERQLTAANALFLSLESTVVVLGPAIGGLVLLLTAPGVAVVLNALSFVVAALVLHTLSTRSNAAATREAAGVRSQVMAGIQALRDEPVALRLVVYCMLCTAAAGTTTVLFVAASNELLGTGSSGLSYLLTAFSIGGVISAGLADRLSAGRLGPAVVIGLLLESIPLALLAVVHQPAVAAALMVVAGAGMVIVDVLAITALQRQVPREVLGRVFGLLDSALYAASIFGSVLASALIGGLSIEAALVILGVGFSVLSLLGVRPLLVADRTAAENLAGLAPYIEALKGLDLFAAANTMVLEQLARSITEVPLADGDVVIEEGDAADALYVLTAGRVSVTSAASGKVEQLRVMTPLSVFGEIGLLHSLPRTATVTALGTGRVWRLSAEAFLEAVSANPVSPSLLSLADDRLLRSHPLHVPQDVSVVEAS